MVIDKCYCINRSDRPKRKEQAVEEFEKISIDVEFVDAVIGDDIATNEFGLIGGYQALNSTLINILDDAIEKGYETIRIFEDDVVFSDDYLEVWQNNVENIPEDFSVFFTGVLFPLSLKTPHIKGRVKAVRLATLGHDIIIKKDIFDTWKESLSKMKAPSDVLLSDIYFSTLGDDNNRKFKCYCFRPGISGQRAGYSDNLKKNIEEIKST